MTIRLKKQYKIFISAGSELIKHINTASCLAKKREMLFQQPYALGAIHKRRQRKIAKNWSPPPLSALAHPSFLVCTDTP